MSVNHQRIRRQALKAAQPSFTELIALSTPMIGHTAHCVRMARDGAESHLQIVKARRLRSGLMRVESILLDLDPVEAGALITVLMRLSQAAAKVVNGSN